MNISESDRKKIAEWAASHPEILEVYQYGSRARGDNREDSDIDLAIVVRPDEGQDNAYAVWVFWEERKNPNLNLAHDVHLEWSEKDAGLERVGPAVEKDGIRLYRG
ncbi:MAG: nucleotidyltransferase domain-containing protein [Pseudomonadota bacterium]